MSDALVLVEANDGVVTVTLNAPERLNALSTALRDQLNAALDEISARPDLRVLVLTGAGRGFCAGADLSEGDASLTPKERGQAVYDSMHNSFNPILKKITDMPAPTIAAVNGVAAGGGFGVALACDLVIAAESAKFILVFTPQLGLIPDCGASWQAPHALGRARAMAATFFGERMSAADAVEAGLIWKSVPDDALKEEVSAVAATLADGPTRAYAEVRKAYDLALRQSFHEQLDYEADTQPSLIESDDYAEGVAAFLEKRKPRFKGR